MGQSHCKEVLYLIYDDVRQGRPPRQEHLQELWIVASGANSKEIDDNRIGQLLSDYLEVALRLAPEHSEETLGGEFVARFWELAKDRTNWKKANMQLMLNIFRRTADHYVQVFIRSLDYDLSGIIEKSEFITKIPPLLFGQGAPLGKKLGYVGVAAFQKEFKMNSLQVEMIEYTNVLDQMRKKLDALAKIDVDKDILIVKCVIKDPTGKTWTKIQGNIEYLLGQVQLDSSTSLDEIGPSIFLSDIQTATDYTELIVNGITHILGIGHYTDPEIRPHFDFTNKFKYLIINDILDEPSQLILDKLEICHSFLWDCLENRGRAIIHSSKGIFSPSAVIVLSWLMKTQDMSYDAALIRLRMKRKCVPNIGFEMQLRKFQEQQYELDPYEYLNMDIQKSLVDYVHEICNRVPKLRKLLSTGSKVSEELLIISLHLYQVIHFEFESSVMKKIAKTIEMLRDIQRNMVKKHRSLREFNKLFPKKEFAWVKQYNQDDSYTSITDKSQDFTNSQAIQMSRISNQAEVSPSEEKKTIEKGTASASMKF